MKPRISPTRCAVKINLALGPNLNLTMVQLAERTGLSLRDTRRTVRQGVVSGHLRRSLDRALRCPAYHLPYLGAA